MSDSTVYDIRLRYDLEDKASAALDSLGHKAQEAGHHVGGLKEGLVALGEAFAAREGFRLGNEYLIRANSELEQLRISMAAVTSFNLEVPFERAAGATDRLVDGWVQFSKSTTLTSKQLIEFGSAIEAGVVSSGGTLKQFDAITKRGALVGSILGAGHAGGLSYVSTELREALSGNVRKTQIFNQQLLGPILHRAGKELEDFNKFSADKRLEYIQKALNDPAWDSALKRQAQSFAGVTSTLKDNIEIAFRDIGLPLFKAISAEIKQWNVWIEQHPKEIADFGRKFGEALISGFNAVKQVVSLIAEHKDTFIRIAEAWAATRVFGALGGSRGLLGGLTGASAGGAAQSGLAGLASNLGALFNARSFGQLQSQALAANAPSLGQVAAGVIAGVGLSALSKDASAFSRVLKGLEGALGTLPGPIGLVGNSLLLLHVGVDAFLDYLNERERKQTEEQARLAGFTQAAAESAKIIEFAKAVDVTGLDPLDVKQARSNLRDYAVGLIDTLRNETPEAVDLQAGRLKERALIDTLTARGLDERVAYAAAYAAKETLDALGPDFVRKFYGPHAEPQAPEDPLLSSKHNGRGKVDVTIHKIEVASPDPDRFAFGFSRAIGRIVRNPTQARDAFREG